MVFKFRVDLLKGYIRNADATSKSSIHWVGLVETNAANKVLRFDLGKSAGGGTLTVPTNEKASVFIEKLSDANNLFSARATQLSTGDNWNAAGEVKWATQETIDSSKFTHSTTSNAHQVTVDGDGDYLLLYSDGLTSAVSRANQRWWFASMATMFRVQKYLRITKEMHPVNHLPVLWFQF